MVRFHPGAWAVSSMAERPLDVRKAGGSSPPPPTKMNMEFLKKIQNLPEKKRKIILYVLTFFWAIILGFFFFKDIKERLSKVTTQFNEIFKIEKNVEK